MFSIAGSLPRPGCGHLSNTNSNCYRPLDVPPQAGDATQATTSMLLSNSGVLNDASDAPDMSNTAEFDDNTNVFETTQDGFETKATIGGLYFHPFKT